MSPRSRSFVQRRWRSSDAPSAGNAHGYFEKEIGNAKNQMGSQLHRMPERYAGHHSRSGISPHAAGCGTSGLAGRARHDPEGSAFGNGRGITGAGSTFTLNASSEAWSR